MGFSGCHPSNYQTAPDLLSFSMVIPSRDVYSETSHCTVFNGDYSSLGLYPESCFLCRKEKEPVTTICSRQKTKTKKTTVEE